MTLNSQQFAKLLATTIGLPTSFKIERKLSRGGVYYDSDGKLLFNRGTVGILTIYANSEHFMEISTFERYTGKQGPAPLYEILTPKDFKHGVRIWVNPTAGATVPFLHAKITSRRGFLDYQSDFARKVEQFFRFTDGAQQLTNQELRHAVENLRYPKQNLPY